MNLTAPGFVFHKIMLRRTNREHGTNGFSDNFFGGRPPERAGKTFAAMRHHRDEINVVVAHCFRDLRRWFTFDDYRFDLKTIEEWISQKFAHFGSELQEPMILLFRENTFGHGEQFAGTLPL